MTLPSARGALLGLACLAGWLVGCPAEQAPVSSGHDHAGRDHASPGHDGHAGHDHAGHGDQVSHDHATHAGHTGHGHDCAVHGALAYGHATQALRDEVPGDIETQPVALSPHHATIKIPATVRLDPDRKVTLSAPIAGRILNLDAPPHATVRAGQRLALLEMTDPEARHLQMRAVQTRAALIGARTERDRLRAYLQALEARAGALAEERRRVAADLEVTEARVRSLDSELAAALTSLRAAGLNGAQIERLERQGEVSTRIGLFAPRLPGAPALEIAARPVSQGQTVAPGDRLFDLVALDRLLVVGEAFEADLPAVRRAAREDLPVTLLLRAEGREVRDLRVRSVEGALDGEGRVTHFFVWLPNQSHELRREGKLRYLDWEFRAGSRAQLLVPTASSQERFVLPAEAVVGVEGKQFVFRRHGDHFDRLAVRAVALDDREAVLPADCGLKPGEEVVTKRALQVHLRLLREQGGAGQAADPHAGHGHAHGHGGHSH